jgi:hypothetical protein
MPLDAKALADVTAELDTRHVAQATAPLLKRIEALESRPVPEKGEKGDPGESIKGDTGVGVAGAVIDRSGVLVLTLSDGSTRDLGVVVGKDGLDGKDGADGAPGEPGKDGSDGLGFDDLEIVHDGERSFAFKLVQGERAKEFPFTVPVVIDRGVYKAGETYAPGDGVTWGGSYWIAKSETDAKPDSGEGWRLAIKRGRDGKDAK